MYVAQNHLKFPEFLLLSVVSSSGKQSAKAMKRIRNSSIFFFLFLLVVVSVTSSIVSVEAGKNHIKKTKPHKHQKDNSNGHAPGPAPPPLPPYGSYPTPMKTFDILSFGGKGNGICDDSQVLRGS